MQVDQVILAREDLHLVVETIEVYPKVIIVRIVARFRSLPTREAQRAVAEQVTEYLRAPNDHDGPRVAVSRATSATMGTYPWGQAGGGGLWRLSFIAAVDVHDDQFADLTFSWPAQRVDTVFVRVPGNALAQAAARITELWEEGHSDYIAVV